MLSDEERRGIDKIIEQYPKRSAASIEALKIVQGYRGFVSDEALGDVAVHLGMSVEELDSVATFYNLIFRRPVGRHVILLCDSISCWILGCDRLRERLEGSLGIGMGETTEDGRFTLLPIACLGTCDHAPALMIGEDTHRDLDPEDAGALSDLLASYEGSRR
jgi:NADH-quinone oxidoreductase subunit E